SELQIEGLTDLHPFEERRVEREQSRTAQCSTCHVAEGPLGRQHEGSRIEPLIRLPQNHWAMEVRIPIGYVRLIGVACPGNIGAGERCERKPPLQTDDPVPLPPADEPVDNST